MSEVAKMYENAGIEPIAEYCKHQCNNEFDDDMCIGCKYIEKVEYPPFTAEKQIEMIKWLMCKKQTIQVELRLYENDYCISHITECEDNDAIEYVETGRKNTFNEALAELVNEIWQDLTEEEKQEIKRILT